MTGDVYERLAAHLDTLPAGFPRSPEGVELRILRRLFTEEEARLACHLTMKPEEPSAIAERAGISPEQAEGMLAQMAAKGLILSMDRGGRPFYMALQYVVGIWEYQVNSLTEELVRDMNAYIPTLARELGKRKNQQLRTIPISKSLPEEAAVMPYEKAREIIAQQSKIGVADCICRKEHRLVGKGCDKPLQNCLVFSGAAHYYLANGLAREISRDEALRILEQAEEVGLVIQPSNSQKVLNMCLCCGCCCQMLKGLKLQPEPARYACSNYYAILDDSRCVGCEMCVERCQMEAVKLVDGIAFIDHARCIGCGLCVPTCSGGALSLKAKPQEERRTPPATMAETYTLMAIERGKTVP